jgi:pimeloyl-ACP methyl ester carboxylesterase
MMTRRLLHSLLFFPARAIATTPAAAGLPFEDVGIATSDGVALHGWWVAAQAPPLGHVLLCHGNAGNVGDRVQHIAQLTAAGFDVLAFDYRGYGRSAGRPSEEGTYRDARAAREALLHRRGVDAARVLYLGESLGAAVALELARQHPPAGLILQSAFTSIRDMARLHYPVVPRALVPDAYPSLRLVRGLDVPLLLLHGERDDIVPLLHGEALFEAATCPKRLVTFPGLGHNDLVAGAGDGWAESIAAWVRA